MSKAINEWLNKLGLTGRSISVEDIINFKRNISCIDNLIAIEQTMLFLDKLKAEGAIKEKDYNRIIDNLDPPNAMGYDVYDAETEIVAELKGTIPCEQGGFAFGGEQKKKIKADLEGLVKSKTGQAIENFKKYMVLFDFAKPAMEKFIRSRTLSKDIKDQIDKKFIQIIYISETDMQTKAHRGIDFKF